MEIFTPELIDSGRLLDLMIDARNRSAAFSAVSVGVTEAHVLAQYTVLREKEFMASKEVWVAAQGVKRGFDHRGIRFPNTEARDLAVEALSIADAVGYNIYLIHDQLVRKVFQYYKITPRYVFESHIRRVIMFSQQEKFAQLLANQKILIVCSYADEVKAALEKNQAAALGFCVTGTIQLAEFEDIPRVKEELAGIDFDLCLIAAGINAVILAPYIARKYGKVVFDLGLGMESLITGKIEIPGYLERYISMEELMNL